MPYYKTPLEKDLKTQMDDTRHLVETLYRIVGEPEPPSKKKIRVGYGCRYEQVWMTSDDMLERIIKVLKQ